MDQFRIAITQMDTIWEQPEQNHKLIDQLWSGITPGETDLILLPETFNTGFTNAAAAVAETMDGPTVSWMKTKAANFQSVIAGSVITADDDTFYNRFVFVFPDGRVSTYDKRHLFTLAKEHEHYTAGKERKVIDIKGWKVFPQVCYDLRFPVWSRNDLGYDLAIYVANWPQPRKEAWRSLLVARAIENQCYVFGVNRVGADQNKLEYPGNSACIDYTGKRLLEMQNAPGLKIISINKQPMTIFRSKLAFLEDRDQFSITL